MEEIMAWKSIAQHHVRSLWHCPECNKDVDFEIELPKNRFDGIPCCIDCDTELEFVEIQIKYPEE